MKKKIIIGLIGQDDYRKGIVLKICKDKDFSVVRITDKVREIVGYLARGTFEYDNLENIRERGYKVNKFYWINLVLSSFPKETDCVVIEDMNIQDVVDDCILTIYVGNGLKPKLVSCDISNLKDDELQQVINNFINKVKTPK